MEFFLWKRIECGFLRVCRSERSVWIVCEQVVERRKSVVRGFSCSRGAEWARARAERAVLGFLWRGRGG